ncbi:hypothetical protein INT47_003914 [Mucor saturninus]|uniref:Integrase catalytic domain-containing protein n=1 Tax=Mucor saturninus TaxID=64648 RepID=A0A8H7ULZ0_9FUNG|nr:hypothetical protein INT47_003914 [Mucor saturninus]
MEYPLYLALMNYLKTGTYPPDTDQSTKRTIRRKAPKYYKYGEKLFSKSTKDGSPRELLHQGNAREIVTKIHEEGHFGVKGTWGQLTVQFSGPGLFPLVQEVVRSCVTCQARSRRSRQRIQPSQPIPTPVHPFYMVGCDAVGPIMPSKRGFKYILVAVDYLTRWPMAAPVKDITEKTTAGFMFDSIVVPHGVPTFILTDRGSNFTSDYIWEFLTLLRCRHIRTTAYRPQTNGLCERTNQSLVQILAKLIRDADAKDHWEDYINPALLALRTSTSHTTGHSPSELLYGYTMRTPATWSAPQTHFKESDIETEVLQRVRKIQEFTTGLRSRAVIRTKARQTADKGRYDLRVRPRKPFKVGEQVLMRDPVPRTKFSDKWLGPMTVVEVKKTGTYILVGPNQRRLGGAVNGDVLVPFHQRHNMIPDKQVQRAQENYQAWLEQRT